MIKITIASAAINEIPYTDKKDGSAKVLRLQSAYAHIVDTDGVAGMYPEKFEFIVPRTGAYPVGDYTLSPASFYVRNGRLSMADARFVPARVAKVQAA